MSHRSDGVAVNARPRGEKRRGATGRAEELLRESEERFRAIVNQATVGICETDLAGRFTFVNDRYCEIAGYAREQLLATRMQDITHPEDLPHNLELFTRLAESGEPFVIEKRYVRPEGSHVWVSNSVSLVRDAAGDPRSVLAVTLDVTERKQAEEKLRESDARLRLAIDISQTSTFDIDLLTDAVQTDRIGREMYGFAADEPLTFGKVRSRFHPGDRDEVMRRVSAALAPTGSDEFEVEQRIIRPGGETRWIRARGRAFFAGGGAARRAVRCLGTYIDITESKRAEEALRESQKLNEDVLNSLTAHIAVLDRDGTITVVNESWRRFARENGADATSRGVGVGANYLAVCGDAEGDEAGDARLIHRAIREVLDGKREFFSLEYPCHSPTTRRWFLLTASPLTRAGGGAVVSHFNITARREAEERRRESEERYRLMTENARDYAIIFLDTEARIKTWSAGAERILGWKEEEVVGQFGDIIFTPEDRADGTPEKELRTAAERGRASDERWHVRRDGSRFFAFGEMIGLFDEAGELRGFAKIFRDLTERKRMDDALRESEEQFRRAVSESAIPVIIHNEDDEIMEVSKGWTLSSGYTRRDIPTISAWTRRAYGERQDSLKKYIDQLFEIDATVHNGEYRVRAKDGSDRVWDFYTTPLGITKEGRRLLLSQAVDITERKRAEEERERLLESEQAARRGAEEASRLKDEFLATVSHELRTPLTAVIGWTHILRAGQLDEAGAARALETVERNARAQNQLIEDLLDISRVITGKLRLNVMPIDPAGFIEAAVEAVRPAAEAKGVRLQKVLDTGVGLISGDADRLQQVVWNLLSNAIKFTPRGGRVQLRLERVNSHVEIIVADTGAGIGPEFLPFVFDRFRQADGSTTRAHGGLGLGLAIVRHLVELHGGAVRADSHGEGRGATFTVELPQIHVYGGAGREEERVHPRASNSLPPAEEGERLDDVRVLVVDDEADTGEMLRAVLAERGAAVVVARSAEEALAEIGRSRFDLLISDIGMPGADGYDLISRVRNLPAARGGRLPAVALTAYARTEDRLRALRAGFQMHVPKPVEPAELIAVVSSLAARSKPPEKQM